MPQPPGLGGGADSETDDTRHDYGERRIVAVGVADGSVLAVAFTD